MDGVYLSLFLCALVRLTWDGELMARFETFEEAAWRELHQDWANTFERYVMAELGGIPCLFCGKIDCPLGPQPTNTASSSTQD